MNTITDKNINDIFKHDDSERALSRLKLHQVDVEECYIHPEKYYFMKKSNGLWILIFNTEIFKIDVLESFRKRMAHIPHLYSGYVTVDIQLLFALTEYDIFSEAFDRLQCHANKYINSYFGYNHDK